MKVWTRPFVKLTVALALATLALAGSSGQLSHYDVLDTERTLSLEEWQASVETFLASEVAEKHEATLRPVRGIVSFDSTSSRALPRCNRLIRASDFYAGNAFYCHAENTIAVDAGGLLPALRQDHGDIMVGVVIAHEYAHAFQRQVGLDGTYAELELHADCVAGAWFTTLADSRPERRDSSYVVLRALDAFDDAKEHQTLAPGRRESFTLGSDRGLGACQEILDAD